MNEENKREKVGNNKFLGNGESGSVVRLELRWIQRGRRTKRLLVLMMYQYKHRDVLREGCIVFNHNV